MEVKYGGCVKLNVILYIVHWIIVPPRERQYVKEETPLRSF
jgi:phage shock protein PspC (stress-responsive transcriptional regulator)